MVRGHLSQKLRPGLVGIDAADVVLLPQRATVRSLVVPEIPVPTTIEISDPGSTADLHFIPLSRGIPPNPMAFSGGGQRKYSGRSDLVGSAAFPFELLRVELLGPRVRVDVLGSLVVPNPNDPGEAEREPARVVVVQLILIVHQLGEVRRSYLSTATTLALCK